MLSGYSWQAWLGARPADVGRVMRTAGPGGGGLTLAVWLQAMVLIAITRRASGQDIPVLLARAISRW